MTSLHRKITLALGVALTLAMIQTSDAQLFRFRRSACPQPAVTQCCSQGSASAVATELAYEAPQAVVESAVVESAVVESATTIPVVQQTYSPVFVQAQPVVEQAPLVIDYPIIDSNVVPTVFESTPTPTPVPEEEIVLAAPTPAVATEEAVLAAPAHLAVPTPEAASAGIVLAAPTPAVEPVPEPVATGETVIKEKMSQSVVAPSVPKASDAIKVVGEAAKEAAEKSILK